MGVCTVVDRGANKNAFFDAISPSKPNFPNLARTAPALAARAEVSLCQIT